LYLIITETTTTLSAAKFDNYLKQQNTLWLHTCTENNAVTNPVTSADSIRQHPLRGNWYSQENIEASNEVADKTHSTCAISNKALKRFIVAATVLNFELLEEIINALPTQSSVIKITANRYHGVFDKMVVNIDCDMNEADSQIETLNATLKNLSEILFIDIFVKPSLSIERPGLAVFDMDSTLIEMECIDEIAKLAGVGDAVSKVTERAMLGEIAFSESLHHRVACLNGVNLDALLSIRKRLPFMPGFTLLINELKRSGWKIAIASGGFTYFADYIKALFDFDYAASNTLEIKDNMLTGKVLGKVVDAQVKADILQQLAKDNGIPISNTLAVGDGANDLVMMSVAGTGVAFKAKPKVQKQASNSIRFSGLEAVLYLLG